MSAVELPSPSLVLTRIVVVEAVAGTQVPPVVVETSAAELGPSVPAACTAPRFVPRPTVRPSPWQWSQRRRMEARGTSAERCRESAGGLGRHAHGFHNSAYGTA